MLHHNSDQNHQTQYSITNARLQVPNDISKFQFSVLTCKSSLLLTKTILADGTVISYDKAKYFQFKYCEIDNLEEFAKALIWLSGQQQRCIIRGQLKPGLTGWQRRLLRSDGNNAATIDCEMRSWIVLDFDNIAVPAGLDTPDKLAEVGYYIRDNLLPAYFRSVGCVAAATAGTGRHPTFARLRLYFLLSQPASNDALYAWADGLSRAYPQLSLDPSVMEPQHVIYTARPKFIPATSDPVPAWGRVRVLDGVNEYLSFDLPTTRKRQAQSKLYVVAPNAVSVSPELFDITATDAGCGVSPLDVEPSDKAIQAIKRMFGLLENCGPPHRRKTLCRVAFEMGRLVAENELPKRLLGMSRSLLNIAKRSLPRLMLSGVGLTSKDAV